MTQQATNFITNSKVHVKSIKLKKFPRTFIVDFRAALVSSDKVQFPFQAVAKSYCELFQANGLDLSKPVCSVVTNFISLTISASENGKLDFSEFRCVTKNINKI